MQWVMHYKSIINQLSLLLLESVNYQRTYAFSFTEAVEVTGFGNTVTHKFVHKRMLRFVPSNSKCIFILFYFSTENRKTWMGFENESYE